MDNLEGRAEQESQKPERRAIQYSDGTFCIEYSGQGAGGVA